MTLMLAILLTRARGADWVVGCSYLYFPPGKLEPSVERMRMMTVKTVTKKTARATMSKRKPVDGRRICVPLHTMTYSVCVPLHTAVYPLIRELGCKT